MTLIKEEVIERVEININKFKGLEPKGEPLKINIYSNSNTNTKDVHDFINRKIQEAMRDGKTIN